MSSFYRTSKRIIFNQKIIKMKEEVWKQIEASFKFIHENLDGFKISEKVDKMGIDNYINYCAGLAAATGAIAGAGGGITLLVGIPADIANTISQQFRVTLAVIYNRTGRYKISFKEFMKIVGLSIGVEAGAKGLEYLTIKIAQEIAKKLFSRGMGRMIPLIGGAVGGGINFTFIKAVGSTLKSFENEIFD